MSSTAARPAERAGVLLELEELRVHFGAGDRLARPVDGVSFQLHAGETLALMGESGSGKSLTALAIMGLLPSDRGLQVAGDVRFEGRSLREPGQLESLRGRRMAMIFQDPRSAMNPVFSIGEQIAESLRTHLGLTRREAAQRAVLELGRVGIASPEQRARQYPHQLSGGMLQRAMIAMAMCTEPSLLIADEPTTALDVTVQAEILSLMRELGERHGMGILLITHDLGVVAENAQRVAVMYAGKLVELAEVDALFARPRHPYTRLLMRSLPELAQPGAELPSIQGSVPRAEDFPSGCRFRTRCPLARERCADEEPLLDPVACHFPEEALEL